MNQEQELVATVFDELADELTTFADRLRALADRLRERAETAQLSDLAREITGIDLGE